MRLTFHQQRIKQRAEIIDRAVFHHLGHPGLRVHLDLGDMAAIREGARHAGHHHGDVERRRQVGRQGEPATQLRRQRHDVDAAIGAGDAEAAAGEFDIGRGGFQHMGGDPRAFGDHRVAGDGDGIAAIHRRARAAGAATDQHFVGITLHQPDLFERHAQLIHQHLGKRRPVPLAVIQRAGNDRHRPIRLEADATHLVIGRRGDFQVLPDPAPAQFAPRPALRPPACKTVPIRRGQCAVEHRREIAAVIFHRRRRLVRHHAGENMVAPTQLDGIDVGLMRRHLDQPLHVIVALGPPGPAIGTDRRGVGHHALHMHR